MKFNPSHLGAALAAAGLSLALGPALAGPDRAQDMRALRDQERQRVNLYKAYFPDLATARKAAISFHAQLLEADYAKGYLVLELEGAEIARLQRFGFRIEHAPDYVARRNEMLDAIESAQSARSGGRSTAAAADAGVQSIPGYACYETVEETYAVAQGFAAHHPNLASWIDVGDSWEKARGLGGWDLRVLKLTNRATGGNKPKLLINGAIHAREYTTAPLVLEFARWLVKGYGTQADATWILDHHEVHLMLHTNPDGRKKAETGLSWRKNTNQDYCGATSNQRGADLNRNFSFSWNSTGGEGSSGNPCDMTFRGSGPASEPEVRAVERYIRSLWRDRRGPGLGDAAPADTSGIHLDIHSYSQLVLWPWGETATPSGNATAFQTLGRRFAWFNGYSPQQSIGLYPTEGTSDGPSYGELGVAAYTFELGTSFFESCSAYNSTIKPDNLPALIYAAKVVRTPYITPAGPDVLSPTFAGEASGAGVMAGTPVALSASVTDTRFNHSNGTEPTQNIVAAEAFIDTPPWLPGAVAIPLAASDGSFDAHTESVGATLGTDGLRPGRHIVYVRGRDAAGIDGPISAVFLQIRGGTQAALHLSASGSRRPWGGWQVDLSWSGATSANVDLYRNGASLGQTRNDGRYREMRSRGTWRYKVCESGSTSACSGEQNLSF
ncbi:M14 family metallopeptidase [Aquabacterium sp. A7-Y]|uniref:M14 family metallopeptidase n=1 Tax=Aquabacterium sp. A7-Y TaxID=1349605 RepID=UPI00223D71E8|nr:M14 family metallopeptidase [Aquabacterium sp. A7-Y]MCW7539965.1 M14 family metallopeptidase [Aquabacterium sp. A7-Y]